MFGGQRAVIDERQQEMEMRILDDLWCLDTSKAALIGYRCLGLV
jgi:hypothetical protein